MERRVPAAWRALLTLVLLGRAAAAVELRCQEITVPLCKGVGYNRTYMPNRFKHDTQDEAGLEVHQFWPLVEIRCSPDLRFFLCAMYTPICLDDYRKPLPPCRAVCERARAGCAPLMRQYGFPWPDRMRCELLPEQGDRDTLCMDYNRSHTTTAAPAVPKPTADRPLKPYNPRKKSYGVRGGGGGGVPGKHKPPGHASVCEPGCFCRAPMVPVTGDGHPLYNRVQTGQIVNCAVPCHSPYLSPEERTFTGLWIGLWSVLCFVSTSVTVATFLIDMDRFQYPERPIIFLSACYMFVSVGYIVRLIAGHEQVACTRAYGAAHVHYSSPVPGLCTLVFVLLYFFGMASSLWWVILSLTWFLAAAMKWGNEAIAGYARYFHLAAWVIPCVKSVAVLALSSVDGDSVAGICYVGNQNLQTLRGFVLAPLLLYLLVGTGFLLAGFVSLFRIRRVIKQGGTKTDKLERLMVRIGVFTVLYTVPATVIVACYFYEQHHRLTWEVTHNCTCRTDPNRAGPDYAVFMLRYFMCLLVGITSGAWIWSGKTFESWRTFCTRCCWGAKASAGGSMYSDVSTGLTWRSGTASSVSCPKQMPLSRV
ncbi:frizzled-8-like [Sphaeramia orbicularis]|uniref:frizzled-8-like n=1 Tax=Sphaeramia orbicularis TaxID=375764 RepID=UPI00117F1384|nr:frizzled-8-like [Sphaeramia orbicularis]